MSLEFLAYERLREDGLDAVPVYLRARGDGLDTNASFRMLREVFGLDFTAAKGVTIKAAGFRDLDHYQAEISKDVGRALAELERMSGAPIVIAGFSDDVAFVRSQLPNVSGIVVLDEKTPDNSEPANVRIAVYVFSRDTGYSSQLLSRFTSIHFRVKPQEEYVVGIGGVDLAKRVFDALKDTPVISAEALAARLGEISDD